MSQDLLVKDNGVIARQEIDMQITTAKAYPRDAKKAVESAVQLATMDEDTAESCFYCLSRKDKDGKVKEIKGASIRLAEIVATTWGNLHAATRIVENDGMFVTAEAVAWDLESNVRIATQNKVSIHGKNKSTGEIYTYNSDMQQMACNAASAKALRNAIFKVVPLSLVNIVLERAMKHAVGDQKTLNDKRNRLFSKFKQMGIEQQKIFDFFNKKAIDEFDLSDVEKLIGIGTAIKDKMVNIDEAFSVTNENRDLSTAERIKHSLANKNKVLIQEHGEKAEPTGAL